MKTLTLTSLVLTVALNTAVLAQDTRYSDLANLPFQQDYPTEEKRTVPGKGYFTNFPPLWPDRALLQRELEAE